MLLLRRIAVGALTMVVIALPPAPGTGAVPASCAGADGAPNQVFTGSFSPAVEGGYVLVPFGVPAAMSRVRVKLCHDQQDIPVPMVRHTLDLGIYQPTTDGLYDREEFRGWGGSSRLNVLITAEATANGEPDSTTVGFIPGPIPPGVWAAEIGVAAIAPGDADGRVAWRLEVFYANVPGDTDTPWTPATYDESPANPIPGWYKGDFHVHARQSNPGDSAMREVFDYAFGPAGLDFITLSDYVTTRHWGEIGAFQADYPGKLIVRSAEVITYRGHINNHASVEWVDYRAGPIYQASCGGDGVCAESGLTPVRAGFDNEPHDVFDAVHAAGGWTQINHPTTFPSKIPGFGNICRGCSWEYSDAETDWSKVDAMEVQTGPAGTPDPDGNELGPNPFTPLAIEWWDRLRRQDPVLYDITAVGSSDSHKAGGESLTTSPIGEATTVVYAPELSEAGIRAGVLAGHAYVKFFGAGGPDLRLEATVEGDPTTYIMGDLVASPSAMLHAEVTNASLHPQPRTLLILRDGIPVLSVPVPTDLALDFVAAVPGDYRLQLQRGSAIEAITNPITLRAVDS